MGIQQVQERQRCAGCKQWFLPDLRSRHPQVFCSKPACRAASKTQSQRKWAAKPENKGYWRGHARLMKLQEWREKHPGYWRRDGRGKLGTLQEQKLPRKRAGSRRAGRTLQEQRVPDDPLIVGLISRITGSTLQGQIARAYRDMIAKGREILGQHS